MSLTKAFPVENPKAISIILGHLGAKSSTLERYGRLYTQMGCSVIASASPPLRFVLNQSLKPTAREILKETIQLLKTTPPTVPLVVHSFSNGGAFLQEQIDDILQSYKTNDEDGYNDDDNSINRQDLDLVASRLSNGCQLFDSCPCYIRMAWDWKDLGSSFPNPHWSSISRTMYTIGASWSLTAWCFLTFSPYRASQFWNNMAESQTCLHQVYIYSTLDMASDATKVENLVQQRRHSYQAVIKTHRFGDSNHCRIDVDHPEEYGEIVKKAVEAAVLRCSAVSGSASREN